MHSADLSKLQKLHSENNLRCRFAHFVHDTFLHICTFAFYRFAHLSNCDFMFCICAQKFCICEFTFEHLSNMNFMFFIDLHRFSLFEQISSKCQKTRKSSKCQIRFRRFLTCSRKCPKKAHVFLSGTRVVPGSTRLTTQGGKSRQNMH